MLPSARGESFAMPAPPPDRSPERLRHHYEVERELAARLRGSAREGRTELFKSLYGELFERVPDHPRLTRRDTPERSRRNIEIQLRLLAPHLRDDAVLVEFAPGDCRLAHAAAASCARVYGVDISDQRAPGDAVPENCELIVYDGYRLDLPDVVADLAFSYQFLEHLHPDDVDLHFQLVHRLLKPGGVYVFDTPNRLSGPHDISRLFGGRLDCFHFQEWTYRGMRALLKRHHFPRSALHRGGAIRIGTAWNLANDAVEALVGALPAPLRRPLAARLFRSVTLSAWKEGGGRRLLQA